MQHSIDTDSGAITISLAEKLSFEDHDKFRDPLKIFESKEYKSCSVNLQQLSAIDSAGLGMLMIAFETAEKNGINFQLAKPQGQVKRLLEISQFDKVMTIAD